MLNTDFRPFPNSPSLASVIRGSASPVGTKFDAYCPSFSDTGHQELIEAMHDHFRTSLRLEEIRGDKHGYRHGLLAKLDDQDLVRILWGGSSGAVLHCEAKGFWTPQWAEFVRSGWPEAHYLTRADVCIDLEEPGAFDKCLEAALDVMRQHNLRESLFGDWNKQEKGRTYALGSRSSLAYLRIYEKGKKDDRSRPDWVRVELEVKPNARMRNIRQKLASMEPTELWGISAWTQDLFQRLSGLAVAKVERERPPASNSDKRMTWLATQCYRALKEVADRVGNDRVFDAVETARETLQQEPKHTNVH